MVGILCQLLEKNGENILQNKLVTYLLIYLYTHTTHEHFAHPFFQLILIGYNLSNNVRYLRGYISHADKSDHQMETQEKDTDGKYQYLPLHGISSHAWKTWKYQGISSLMISKTPLKYARAVVGCKCECE